MSAFEALRDLRDKLPWLQVRTPEPVRSPPERLTIVQEMEILVQLANTPGQIERGSPTWAAVRQWAATELLEAFAKQESADDEKAAALRAQTKVLRKLLDLMEQRKPARPVKFADASPHIE